MGQAQLDPEEFQQYQEQQQGQPTPKTLPKVAPLDVNEFQQFQQGPAPASIPSAPPSPELLRKAIEAVYPTPAAKTPLQQAIAAVYPTPRKRAVSHLTSTGLQAIEINPGDVNQLQKLAGVVVDPLSNLMHMAGSGIQHWGEANTAPIPEPPAPPRPGASPAEMAKYKAASDEYTRWVNEDAYQVYLNNLLPKAMAGTLAGVQKAWLPGTRTGGYEGDQSDLTLGSVNVPLLGHVPINPESIAFTGNLPAAAAVQGRAIGALGGAGLEALAQASPRVAATLQTAKALDTAVQAAPWYEQAAVRAMQRGVEGMPFGAAYGVLQARSNAPMVNGHYVEPTVAEYLQAAKSGAAGGAVLGTLGGVAEGVTPALSAVAMRKVAQLKLGLKGDATPAEILRASEDYLKRKGAVAVDADGNAVIDPDKVSHLFQDEVLWTWEQLRDKGQPVSLLESVPKILRPRQVVRMPGAGAATAAPPPPTDTFTSSPPPPPPPDVSGTAGTGLTKGTDYVPLADVQDIPLPEAQPLQPGMSVMAGPRGNRRPGTLVDIRADMSGTPIGYVQHAGDSAPVGYQLSTLMRVRGEDLPAEVLTETPATPATDHLPVPVAPTSRQQRNSMVSSGIPAQPGGGAQGGAISTKPLYEMNPDELAGMAETLTAADKDIEVQLFGPAGAARYNRLQRTANSSTASPESVAAAMHEIEGMEGTLTPEQQNRLFGIGDTSPALDDVHAFQNAQELLELRGETPEGLAQGMHRAITDIGEATNPAEMTRRQQLAYAQIRRAHEIAQEKGWDAQAILLEAIRQAAAQYHDPADAAFMLQRFEGLFPQAFGSPRMHTSSPQRRGDAEGISSGVAPLALPALTPSAPVPLVAPPAVSPAPGVTSAVGGGGVDDSHGLEARATSAEQRILDAIGTEPTHVDQIIERSGLTPAQVSSHLVMMELGGKVKRSPGNLYTAEKLPDTPVLPTNTGTPDAQVLATLGTEPMHIDSIVQQSGLSPAQVSAALVMLELQGKAQKYPGNLYSIPTPRPSASGTPAARKSSKRAGGAARNAANVTEDLAQPPAVQSSVQDLSPLETPRTILPATSAGAPALHSIGSPSTPTVSQGTGDVEGAVAAAQTSPVISRDEELTLRQALGAHVSPLALAVGETDTVKNVTGTMAPVHWAIVEADDLITSHTTDFEVDARHGAGFSEPLQLRDLTEPGEQGKIRHFIATFDPREVVGDGGGKANDGAPTITPDGRVVAGNGRTIMLKTLFQSHPDKAKAYWEFLLRRAQIYGLTEAQIRQARQPVLVRIGQWDTPEALVSFARDTDKKSTGGMGVVQLATGDAERLAKADILSSFVPNETGEINTVANRNFIRQFVQAVIPATEREEIMTSDGTLSQDGIRRVKAALFKLAYNAPNLVETIFEDPNNPARNVTNALLGAAPRMVAIRRKMDAGQLQNVTPVIQDMVDAVSRYLHLAERGVKIQDELQQVTMGLQDDGLTPLAREVLGFFDRHKRSGRKLLEFFNAFVDSVEKKGNPQQVGLFGEVTGIDGAQLVRDLLRELEAKWTRTDTTGTLGGTEVAPSFGGPSLLAPTPEDTGGLFRETSASYATEDGALTPPPPHPLAVDKTLTVEGVLRGDLREISQRMQARGQVPTALRPALAAIERYTRQPSQRTLLGIDRALKTVSEIPGLDEDVRRWVTMSRDRLHLPRGTTHPTLGAGPFGPAHRTPITLPDPTAPLPTHATHVGETALAPGGRGGIMDPVRDQLDQMLMQQEPYHDGQRAEERQSIAETLAGIARESGNGTPVHAGGDGGGHAGADRPGLREGNSSSYQVLGVGITPPVADLARTGHTDLIGRVVSSPEELGALAQIYRNPAFETLRFIALNDAGEIVFESGVSAHLPGATLLYPTHRLRAGKYHSTPTPQEILERRLAQRRHIASLGRAMARFGATKYVLLHNHPSGHVTPSADDYLTIANVQASLPGNWANIIIDHHKIGLSTPAHPEFQEVEVGDPTAPDPILTPSLPHPELGQNLLEPAAYFDHVRALVNHAQQLYHADDHLILTYLGADGNVRAIERVPLGQFRSAETAIPWIRGRMRQWGGRALFATAFVKDHASIPQFKATVQALKSAKMITDALIYNTDGILSTGERVPEMDLYLGHPLHGIQVREEMAQAPQAPQERRPPEGGFTFENPEIEKRYAAAAVSKTPWLQRMQEFTERLFHQMTRIYPDLPRGRQYAEAHEALRWLGAQHEVQARKALETLRDITEGLDADSFALFSRQVIMDDLMATLKKQQEQKQKVRLPFGFDEHTLAHEHARLSEMTNGHPAVQASLGRRKAIWEDLRRKYIENMSLVAFDVADRLTREDYFRHLILDYADAQQSIAAGNRKLQVNIHRGYLQRRTGYEGDISTDYLGVEYQVMSQMMYDMAVADTLLAIEGNYDIVAQLKEQAIVISKKNGYEHVMDWHRLIPEGYTAWAVREGFFNFATYSIPNKLAAEAIAQGLETLNIPVEELKKIQAVGGRFQEYVIPMELAKTLDAVLPAREDSALAQFSRATLRAWKQSVLLMPRRLAKYNLRNTSGDLEVVLRVNPSAVRYIPQAARELLAMFRDSRQATPTLRDWMDRGGTQGTLQAQEMGQVNELAQFVHLLQRQRVQDMPARAWTRYWTAARMVTDYREAILRYATYLDYLQKIEASPSKWRLQNYGASIPEEVNALHDPKDRAYKLSNELMGAYDSITALGQELRAHLMPFWSWNEVNLGREIRILRNASNDGKLLRTLGGTMTGATARTALALGKWLLGLVGALSILHVYNQLVHPDEERDLPDDVQGRPHLVLGRDKDGTVRYFDRLGAVTDFLEWFGLDNAPHDIRDVLSGKRTLGQILSHNVQSPVNKVAQGIHPGWKLAAELTGKKALFPNVFEPHSIRDPWQHAANAITLQPEYDALMGKPQRMPYWETWMPGSLLTYTADPEEAAYYDILGARQLYIEQLGKPTTAGDFLSDKSNALWNLKRAIRYNDQAAIQKYTAEYQQLGGHVKGLRLSVQAMDPYHGLTPSEQEGFRKYLGPAGAVKLGNALKYFQRIDSAREGVGDMLRKMSQDRGRTTGGQGE